MNSGKQGNIFKDKLTMTLFPKIQFKEMKSKLRGRSSYGDKAIPKIAIIPPTPNTTEDTYDSVFGYALPDGLPKALNRAQSSFRRNSEPWRDSGKGNNLRKRRPRNERSLSLPESEERTKDLLQVPTTPRRKKKVRRRSLSDDEVNLKWITDNARIDRQVMSFARPAGLTIKQHRMGSIREEKHFERSYSAPENNSSSNEFYESAENSDEEMFDVSEAKKFTFKSRGFSEGKAKRKTSCMTSLGNKTEDLDKNIGGDNDRLVFCESNISDDNRLKKMDTDFFNNDIDQTIPKVFIEKINAGDDRDFDFRNNVEGKYHKGKIPCLKATRRSMSFDEERQGNFNTAEMLEDVTDQGNIREEEIRNGKEPAFTNFQQGRALLHKITNDIIETVSPKHGKHNMNNNNNIECTTDCQKNNKTGFSLARKMSDVADHFQKYTLHGLHTDSDTTRKFTAKNTKQNAINDDSSKPIGLFCLDNLLEALNRTT